MNISCIYKILNTRNNKCYIGSSLNFRKRRTNHLRDLRNNKHCNKHLQRAFNKYAESSFAFELIELCDKNDLLKLEQEYIDTLNPEYNICKIAGNILGIKRSRETCSKISKSNSGKVQHYKQKYSNSASHRVKKGKIYQFNKTGELIKIWDDTITNIAKELSMKRSTISESIRLNRISKDFIWKVESEVSFG